MDSWQTDDLSDLKEESRVSPGIFSALKRVNLLCYPTIVLVLSAAALLVPHDLLAAPLIDNRGDFEGMVNPSSGACSTDPFDEALRQGYVIQSGSAEDWELDGATPKGPLRYIYTTSFMMPDSTDIDPESVTAYNSSSFYGSRLVGDTICKKVTKWLLRCFRKEDDPRSVPPVRPETPGQREGRCIGVGNVALNICRACGCSRCYEFGDFHRNFCLGRACMELPDVSRCVRECRARPADVP